MYWMQDGITQPGQMPVQNDPYLGRDIAGRIMSAEYNQQVQSGNYQQAGQTMAQMFGYWLSNRLR